MITNKMQLNSFVRSRLIHPFFQLIGSYNFLRNLKHGIRVQGPDIFVQQIFDIVFMTNLSNNHKNDELERTKFNMAGSSTASQNFILNLFFSRTQYWLILILNDIYILNEL